MGTPILGEIRKFGFNFAPRGWAMCNGQLMPISQNTALFSLLGTTYGGDGQSTFALPNLQGRVPIHQGQGTGLSNRVMGEVSGEEAVTLLVGQLPAHNHQAQGSNQGANNPSPAGNVWAAEPTGQTALYSNTAPNTPLAAGAIGTTGGSQPHDNMPPFLVVNFCIALAGIFPSRN